MFDWRNSQKKRIRWNKKSSNCTNNCWKRKLNVDRALWMGHAAMKTMKMRKVWPWPTIAIKLPTWLIGFCVFIHFAGEANKMIADYKFKLTKAEQEIATLQASLARSETQVIRYKSTADATEKAEADLKIERRKLQREVSEQSSILLNLIRNQ